jgi:hypothetical protein
LGYQGSANGYGFSIHSSTAKAILYVVAEVAAAAAAVISIPSPLISNGFSHHIPTSNHHRLIPHLLLVLSGSAAQRNPHSFRARARQRR